MHVIDSTMLLLFFRPAVLVPNGLDGRPISSPKQRIEHLIETLGSEGVQILVPTPVLSEILIRASNEQFQEIPRIFDKHTVFRVEGFDTRAAIELAFMNREDLPQKKGRAITETAAKVKLDRQIVAIGKVNGATAIYSDDNGLRAFAMRHGLKPIGLGELPLPATKQQIDAFDG